MDENLIGHSFINQLSSPGNHLITKSSISLRHAISILRITRKWREATVQDIAQIECLINNEACEFFGDVNLVSLIELSPYAVVIEDDSANIVGFLCLNNFPNIGALLPEVWGEWMKHHYKLNELHYENTLFVHYIVWDRRLRVDYLNIYLQDLFLNDVKLEYICLVSPPSDAGISYVKKPFVKILFSRALPFGNYSKVLTQTLYICFRSSLVSKMKIRRALPEDNDDLVEILDTTAPKLRNYYGDYYIAEIVSKNQPNRSIIVAEINNQSVGMMCLNTQVDLEKLNLNFELLPFHALRKYHFNTGTEKMQIREIIMRESLEYFAEITVDDAMVSFQTLSASSGASSNYTYNSNLYDDETKPKDTVASHTGILETLETQCSDSTVESIFEYEVMAEWEEVLKKFVDRKTFYDERVREVTIPISDPNVMAIELFGISSELDERVSIDLLKAAFDTYRNRDYCLLTLPATAYMPSFLNYFTRAIPRPECSFPDNLYIIHKNILSGLLEVAYLKREHLPDVYNLIDYEGENKIEPAEQMFQICVDFVSNAESIYHVLMIRSEETLVGIIILRPADAVEHLRLQYCLDAYENNDIACSPNDFGQMAYAYLNPLFIANSTFIFKELFRITGFKSVYYLISSLHGYLDFFNTLLPVMFPMKPRRTMNLPDVETFNDIEPDPLAFLPPGSAAAYYTNIRLSAFRRQNIDARIVVVGFGQTSKAFLEALIYRQESQHLRFTNLTCICPAGILEADTSYVSNCGTLFSPDRLFNKEYMKQLELRVWVNFVPGYMTQIQRKFKYVVLDQKERLPYDKLFLFCGLQFDVPVEVFNAKKPENLVLINKLIHVKMVNYKIKNIVRMSGFKIIVYGRVLRAFAGINYLLNAGVKGEAIHFIIPPTNLDDEMNLNTFDDDYVEACVFTELEKAHVHIYNDFKFVMWNIDEKTNMIKTITFQSTFQCLKLPCTLFFCYNRKVVNKLTVKALNRSGLVFDGRVVIDANNTTNDPNIFAAGSLTKYRRILYADRFRHMYYNSKEIGIKLALKLVDYYTQTESNDTQSEDTSAFKWTVPEYSFPIVESVTLPGNYYYLHIRRPGFQLPNYVAVNLNNYGIDLITGGFAQPLKAPSFLDDMFKAKWHQAQNKLALVRDYCRIYLDKNGFIKTIICLSRKIFDWQDMTRIWGMHEKLLNNMKFKYLSGEITDFYSFFNERWAHILHHDRFFKLQEMNEKVYRSNLDGIPNWLTDVLDLATNNNRQELSAKERQALIQYYQSAEFVEKIEKNLLDFLNEHKESLFMYATPDVIAKKFNEL